MKKVLLIVVALAFILMVVFYLFNTGKSQTAQQPAEKKEKPAPLAISKNPEAFNDAFGKMMDAYYTLKNDLVNWDSTKAGKDAATLKQLAKEVPYETLQADKNIVATAQNFSVEIAAESENLTKAGTIELKRRAFNTISDHLYSLLNTVRYDKEVIYHDMCPMAFNDTEQGYWLSRDSAISNPYLGNKHPKYKSGMITCGEVQDSIHFAVQ